KLLAGVESGATLINLHKCFLGQIRRVLLILQTADEIVEKLFSMTLHQIIHGRVVARDEAGHVLRILLIRAGRVHAWASMMMITRAFFAMGRFAVMHRRFTNAG